MFNSKAHQKIIGGLATLTGLSFLRNIQDVEEVLDNPQVVCARGSVLDSALRLRVQRPLALVRLLLLMPSSSHGTLRGSYGAAISCFINFFT